MTRDELIDALKSIPHNCEVRIAFHDEDGDPIEHEIVKLDLLYEASLIPIHADD